MRFKNFVDYTFRTHRCRRKLQNILDDVVAIFEGYKEDYDFSGDIALPLAVCFQEQKSPWEDLFFKTQIGFPRAKITTTFFLEGGYENEYELMDIRVIPAFHVSKNLRRVFNSLNKFKRFKSIFPTEDALVSFYLLVVVYDISKSTHFNQAREEIDKKINEKWEGKPFKLIGEYDITPNKDTSEIYPYLFKFLLFKS